MCWDELELYDSGFCFLVWVWLVVRVDFFYVFFFFSSRRRHTRLTCDWSSDVCSSDLPPSSRNGDQHEEELGGGEDGLTVRGQEVGKLVEIVGHPAGQPVDDDLAQTGDEGEQHSLVPTQVLGPNTHPAQHARQELRVLAQHAPAPRLHARRVDVDDLRPLRVGA